MEFIDLTLYTGAENLALDEAFLLAAEEHAAGEVLRFWELADYAVVLGSASRFGDEVRESACRADGVPILRRASGGGAVVLGPGCLVFSLVLSLDRPGLRDVHASYEAILEPVCGALRDIAPGIARAGLSDLVRGDLGDRKFSGNSQRRMRQHLLHHGTILYDFELSRIERYLAVPQRQPAYRRDRGHDAFVANLPLAVERMKDRLRSAWSAQPERMAWPETVVRRLVETKYATEAWTRRR
jgi:lipoate-protein ligase A